MEERPRQDVSDVIAGGVDNVKHVEVYVQAVFLRNPG